MAGTTVQPLANALIDRRRLPILGARLGGIQGPGWTGKTLLLLGDPAATGMLERALATTSAPHPRLGLLVDLAMARTRDGDADHAIALLVEGAQLAVERGIEGFARWRLQEGRAHFSPAQQRTFDSRLQAVA